MELLTNLQGIVALGGLAFDQALVLLNVKSKGIGYHDFAHGSLSQFNGNLPWLLASYHPSRQNTQTGKLTEGMFEEIWDTAKSLLV